MYEKILVPLDGSSAAQIVLPYAEEIAVKFRSDIILVSVSESKAVDIDHLYHSYLEHITEQVKAQLEEYGIKKMPRVYHDALLGEPAEQILKYADESNVSLITIASRGSSGRGPWLIGNIAAKVLRAAHKPVLLIRDAANRTALQEKRLVKKILVPLDGSKTGEAAIASTAALAQALEAELVMLQVLEPVATFSPIPGYSETYLDGVGKPLIERGLKTTNVVVNGSPAEQIIDYTEANSIDLIAMSTHGRSGIGRWVFGSVTDKVLHAGNKPVLVVPAVKA